MNCKIVASLLVVCLSLTGCGLSKKEKNLIDSAARGRIQAKVVSAKTEELWSDVYKGQLGYAYTQRKKALDKDYQEKRQADFWYNGSLSGLQTLSGQPTFHEVYRRSVKTLNNSANELMNDFSDIRSKMSEAMMKDFYSARSRIGELLAVYKGEKDFSTLGDWVKNPEFEQLITPFMLSHSTYDTQNDGLLNVEGADNINLQPAYYECLNPKAEIAECTQYYAYTMMYHFLMNTPVSVNLSYLIKVKDSENSYILGYDNMEAYICTLIKRDKGYNVLVKDTEFNQTLIGKGI